MDIILLSLLSTVLCVLAVFAVKYLSLLRWISGNAYVLSKKKSHFSILEVLDLFKNVRPFPISNQKGWKIDSYAHGHRIWFSFLTFPHNINAPSIKVFAAFDRIASSSQALLQVLRDISQTCDWKPGVISVSHTHCLKSHEVPSTSRGGLPSMPVQLGFPHKADCIKEERLLANDSKFSLQYPDPWVDENVIPTMSVEFKRFWHREDNGVCWLLQMNEKLQTCEFFLIQPVADVEQCLLSVVTWTLNGNQTSKERASVLLSSLEEYMSVRRLQKTPLLSITLPQDMSDDNRDSSDSSQGHGDNALFSPLKKFSKPPVNGNVRQAELAKYSHILRFNGAANSDRNKDSVASNGNLNKSPKLITRSQSDASALRQRSPEQDEKDDEVGANDDGDKSGQVNEKPVNEVETQLLSSEDLQLARYKTLSNQCAAELLAEAVRASNLDLHLTPERQSETSKGWRFSSFEKNIVVLKKIPSAGSTVQSYIGKGFVLAPPRTVWDAVRNPRTRFTYDETLKKVDIVDSMDSALKIVYYFHESHQFMSKTSCDMCALQGEREEGDKFVLTYSHIKHDKCPPSSGVTRAKFYPSGWIIEPARQDNKVYSIVTYLMQIDFGPSLDNSDKKPFEEMISRYPLSISLLQQYLKPALRMLRRKSLN